MQVAMVGNLMDMAVRGMDASRSWVRRLRDGAAGVRQDGSLDQHGLARRRLVAAAVAAAVALAVALAAGASWPVAVDVGWDGAALLFLLWVWSAIGGKSAAQTAKMARAEDASQPGADLTLLSASVASLVAVGFVLSQASRDTGASKGLLIALALVSVTLAWASVHTIYTLRYADLYYQPPVGGINYHADEPPDYRDLAYVALTIGMTFQVSDTDLTHKPIRRTATRHALLSFLFGACIVAITINIVGSLLSK
jgi:uncharacterized membrane protein